MGAIALLLPGFMIVPPPTQLLVITVGSQIHGVILFSMHDIRAAPYWLDLFFMAIY